MPYRYRKRRYDVGSEPWWLKQVGGMPGWAIAAITLILVGVAVLFVWDALGG
jgi:hypothetical protein